MARNLGFGSRQYDPPGVTNPPEIPENRVSADATRLQYTAAQLATAVGTFDRCVVLVSDLGAAPAEWRAGDLATANGTTILGTTDQGRWYMRPGGGAGVTLVDGLLVSELSTTSISAEGEVRVCSGGLVEGDGGGGIFYGDLNGTQTAFYGMVVATTNGRWIRVWDHHEINLRWLGAREGTANVDTFHTAVTRARAWADSDLQLDDDIVLRMFLPKAADIYEINSSYVPPGGNHRKEQIRGEGFCCSHGNAYGHSSWRSSPTPGIGGVRQVVGGTVLRAANNVDVVQMLSDGTDSASIGSTMYRKLILQDIALITTGTGMGIRTGAVTAATYADLPSGYLACKNVFVGGAAVGWQCVSVEKAHHDGFITRGCDVGLRLGQYRANRKTWNGSTYVASPAPQGCTTQHFSGLDLQYCNTGLQVQGAWNCTLVQPLIQANTTQINVPNNASNQRCVVEGAAHIETATNWITVGSTQTTNCGLTFRDVGFQVGTPITITLYGSGWIFDTCGGLEWLTINAQSGQHGLFRDCVPAAISPVSGHRWQIGASQVLNCAIVQNNVSGTFTHGLTTHGLHTELGVVGNITLANPPFLLPGMIGCISVYQDLAGGWTVSFGSNWKNTSLWSNSGNTAGNISWIYYEADSAGRPWITKVTPYQAV